MNAGRDNCQNSVDVWKCERPYHWLSSYACYFTIILYRVFKTAEMSHVFLEWFILLFPLNRYLISILRPFIPQFLLTQTVKLYCLVLLTSSVTSKNAENRFDFCKENDQHWMDHKNVTVLTGLCKIRKWLTSFCLGLNKEATVLLDSFNLIIIRVTHKGLVRRVKSKNRLLQNN